jgi:hypothetical protein
MYYVGTYVYIRGSCLCVYVCVYVFMYAGMYYILYMYVRT